MFTILCVEGIGSCLIRSCSFELLLLWLLVTSRRRIHAWLELQLFRHQLQYPKPTVDTRHHFCPKTSCAYYGWFAKGNLTSNGFPNSGKSRQLYCKACGKLFSETTGTLFYGLKTSPETVLLALKVLAEGLDLQATARVFEVKEATVQHWLELASEQMEAVSAYLIQELHVNQVQGDEMWSLLGKRDAASPDQRKTRWLWSAIDSDSKLWLAYLIADRSLNAAQAFIHQVTELLEEGCVPLFLSDGYKPYEGAILTHFGHWKEQVSESRRKRWYPLRELDYAQVVKQRRSKRLVSVTRRGVYGSLESVQTKRQASVGKRINTAFIERFNLMLRQRVPALARKTLALAKNEVALAKHEVVLEQQLNLRRGCYNFCLPHASLRQRLPEPIPTNGNGSPKLWLPPTPAMAAGITDHIWNMEELLRFRAPPWKQAMPTNAHI